MKIILIAVDSVAIFVLAQFSLKAGMCSAAVRAFMAQADAMQSAIAIARNKFVLLGFCCTASGRSYDWRSCLSGKLAKHAPWFGHWLCLRRAGQRAAHVRRTVGLWE